MSYEAIPKSSCASLATQLIMMNGKEKIYVDKTGTRTQVILR